MKTENQDMIELYKDEGDYAPLFPVVLQSKLTPFKKLLLTLMMNDIQMNGAVTWKQSTYADKMNSDRNVIVRYMKDLIKDGILIPNENNKAGSKNNTYCISFSAIEDYKPDTSGPKPDTFGPKPDTSGSKPDTFGSKPDTFGPKPDTREYHIKKDKETNKETKKENKESLKEEDTSFYAFMEGAKEENKTIEEKELDIFLQNLDI